MRGSVLRVALAGLGTLASFAAGYLTVLHGIGWTRALPVAAPPPPELPSHVADSLPVTRDRALHALRATHGGNPDPLGIDPAAPARLFEWVDVADEGGGSPRQVRIDYSLDSDLTRRVFKLMRRARVERGHVIVMEPSTGRILVYASSDVETFPPTRAYPAASLVKVITAAAALDTAPEDTRRDCRFRGSPYRLTRARITPPERGRVISFAGALATSNNQCFAQLAVHSVGRERMLAAVDAFGWRDAPARGHSRGLVVPPDGDEYELGRLGSGLAPTRITPLHAVQLAGTLADGELVEPWWVDRVVAADGRVLVAAPERKRRRVMTRELTEELRTTLVRTTMRGTARSAFRDRRGRYRLGDIRVAGKTGTLSGREPKGRYEWFVGAAPADAPTIAIAVVQVHGHLWWTTSSQLAGDVFAEVFCERGRCRRQLAARYTGRLGDAAAPVFLSASRRQ